MPRAAKNPPKKQVAVYLTDAQKQTLDRLCVATRIPMTVLVAEAVDDLFVKYQHLLGSEEQP